MSTNTYEGSATWEKRQEPVNTEWRPCCLMCSTMTRMEERPYGFECVSTTWEPGLWINGMLVTPGRFGCGNKINWNLTHYESEVDSGG